MALTKLTWAMVLAWRMRRQLLDPVGTLPVEDVVRRLGGVQAQVASSAELAVRVRRAQSEPGEVGRALADGRLIKTWAMRGTLHLLAPADGGAFLSLIAAAKPWARPSWVRSFGLTPGALDRLRDAVRDALDDRILTREELVAAVVDRKGLEHVGEGLRSGWGTLLKPLAWQGELAFGPSQGTRVTFMRPAHASSRWAGLPDPDAAAPLAIAAYLRAYGPATSQAFGTWLAGGFFGTRQLRSWFDAMGDRLAEVVVDGERALILADDRDDLARASPTAAVRLLPGFDQYVLGPGTADGRVVPAARRAQVSRQAGWISPVVVAGGSVAGTWELGDDRVRVTWFGESGRPRERALRDEVDRLGIILGRDLTVQIDVA